jgi:transcriptional regulator with GAF, ATPase, and Fis domain
MSATDAASSGSPDLREEIFAAVTAAFASLGRVCLALDSAFRIRHVSPRLDDLLGAGAAARTEGRPVEELLGPELFGSAGPMRSALAAGERREGWRAWLKAMPDGSRLVSVSAAPLIHATRACDPEAAYLVVLRPADEEEEVARDGVPTASAGIIARSRAMTEVLRLVERLQRSDVTVLVTGESGVGKGVIAQAIHANSLRSGGPFVAVNCAALPEALLESELFGHVRGAFTGAVRDRVGRFEAAARGTLFLDEVGDLPLHLQTKLLRVLQDRTFERVGESQPIAADVRVVAATHRDLRRAVEEGRFREDLFYRLRVFPIEIPPLRARREDIEPLARYLLAQVSQRSGRALAICPEALRALLAHDWPGNVRELENALEYGATVAEGQTLQRMDLPRDIVADARSADVACGLPVERAPPGGQASEQGRSAADGAAESRRDRLRSRAPTRDEITAALEAHRWRIAASSRSLGISRTTLWRLMRELELKR